MISYYTITASIYRFNRSLVLTLLMSKVITLLFSKLVKKHVLVIFLFMSVLSSYASEKADTVTNTYFTNHHPQSKAKYSLYLVFQLSNFLNPTYKVTYNFLMGKYDTTHLTSKDIIHDSLNPEYIYHFHDMGIFKHLASLRPQNIFLLDAHRHMLAMDIVKEREIRKLAEMYATPHPDDTYARKVHYYKLTGIAVAGVGNVKDQQITNPMIRMSCKEKKKFYRENGINGQHAMVGF